MDMYFHKIHWLKKNQPRTGIEKKVTAILLKYCKQSAILTILSGVTLSWFQNFTIYGWDYGGCELKSETHREYEILLESSGHPKQISVTTRRATRIKARQKIAWQLSPVMNNPHADLCWLRQNHQIYRK